MWKRVPLSLPTGFLLLSLLIGFTIRVWLIFQSDFWFDEAFTYHVAKLPLPELLPAVLSDNNPPLYYLLIHAVLTVSRHEAVLRLPSLLFNFGAVYFLYKFLLIAANRQTAATSAGLFLVSPLTVYLATNARLHAAGLFFIPCLVYIFLKLAKQPNRLWWLTFILVGILGVYTQYYVALLFLPMTLLVMRGKTGLTMKRWVSGVGIVILSILPWLTSSVRISHNVCFCPPSFLSLPASLMSPILSGIGEVSLRTFITLPLPLLLFYTSVTFIVFLFFIKGLFKNRQISILYIFPLTVLTITGFSVPLFTPKGFSIYSPLFFGIVGLGLNDLKFKKKIILIPLLVGLVTMSQLKFQEFRGTPIKPVIPLVSGHTNLPIAHTSSITYYSLRYYLPSIEQLLLTQNPYQPLTVRYIGGGTQPIPNSWQQFWLVDTKNWVEENERQTILNNIYIEYSTQTEFQLNQVAVKLLKRK